jgi:hypothetical protein
VCLVIIILIVGGIALSQSGGGSKINNSFTDLSDYRTIDSNYFRIGYSNSY